MLMVMFHVKLGKGSLIFKISEKGLSISAGIPLLGINFWEWHLQSLQLFRHLPPIHYPDKPNQNVFPHTEPEKVWELHWWWGQQNKWLWQKVEAKLVLCTTMNRCSSAHYIKHAIIRRKKTATHEEIILLIKTAYELPAIKKANYARTWNRTGQ